jgi:hypothetical protein
MIIGYYKSILEAQKNGGFLEENYYSVLSEFIKSLGKKL